MPLAFPPAPAAYFLRAKDARNEVRNEASQIENEFNIFPLGHVRGAVPVEPLSASPQMPKMPPVPPHRLAPLGHLLQNPASVPMMPPQRNPMAPPQAIPQMPMVPPAQAIPQMPMVPPPQAVPQLPPPMIPQSAPPEKAAEQFRRMNSSLPDGVRYEPLDDETMRILKGAAKASDVKPAPQKQSANPPVAAPEPRPAAFSAPAPQPLAPESALPAESAEILKRIAQDERNASVFYAHFANANESFAVLAKDSKARFALYVKLLAENFHEDFAPQETEINTSIEISGAVVLAIAEENKGLIALGNLLDTAADTPAEKLLGRALNRKIIGHNLLLALKALK